MLTSLHLSRFRAFESLTMNGLTRVNLLVGANNAGKTCVLEGLELLLGGGSPQVMWRGAIRRGEIEDRDGARIDVDVCHLFHGYEISPGTSFELAGQDHVVDDEPVRVVCEIIPAPAAPDAAQQEIPIAEDILETEPPLAMRVRGRVDLTIPLTGTRRMERIQLRPGEEAQPVTFVEAGDSEPSLAAKWDRIVLTPEEGRVIDALRIIEPRIDRIAPLRASRYRPGNFYVKLTDSDRRLPLGSMGDGLRRLLILATNLAASAGGFLLVDEIDTGLHHSVIVKTWRLLVEAARQLKIQVFATTHSLDCVMALAQLAEQMPSSRDEVSLHRIDRNAVMSTKYSLDEVNVAIQHQMEIR